MSEFLHMSESGLQPQRGGAVLVYHDYKPHFSRPWTERRGELQLDRDPRGHRVEREREAQHSPRFTPARPGAHEPPESHRTCSAQCAAVRSSAQATDEHRVVAMLGADVAANRTAGCAAVFSSAD